MNKKIIKLIVVILILIALFFIIKYTGLSGIIKDAIKKALLWIDDIGPWGPIVFILIYILACVFFISGALLTLGAGAIFGIIKGTILVSIGSVLGATLAFLIGRYIARGWVAKKIDENPNFKAIDEAVANEGWKIVGLVRLSPVFPFVFLNYAFGLTKVSLRDYFFASWIGMLPGTIMYVYIGSIIGNVAALGAGVREKNIAEWALYIIGLVATIVVTIYITRVAQKALKKKFSE